jgi:predicted TIM-barrel fold metal-dependent hydrolase
MEDFATLELNDEVRSAILKENALRVLGIGDAAG